MLENEWEKSSDWSVVIVHAVTLGGDDHESTGPGLGVHAKDMKLRHNDWTSYLTRRRARGLVSPGFQEQPAFDSRNPYDE